MIIIIGHYLPLLIGKPKHFIRFHLIDGDLVDFDHLSPIWLALPRRPDLSSSLLR